MSNNNINVNIMNINSEIDHMNCKIPIFWTTTDIIIFYISYHKEIKLEFLGNISLFCLGKKINKGVSLIEHLISINCEIKEDETLNILIKLDKVWKQEKESFTKKYTNYVFLKHLYDDFLNLKKNLKLIEVDEVYEVKKMEMYNFYKKIRHEMKSLTIINNSNNSNFEKKIIKIQKLDQNNENKLKENQNIRNNFENLPNSVKIIINIIIVIAVIISLVFLIFYKNNFIFFGIQFLFAILFNVVFPYLYKILQSLQNKFNDNLKLLEIPYINDKIKASYSYIFIAIIISFLLSVFTKFNKNSFNKIVFNIILNKKMIKLKQEYKEHCLKEQRKIFLQIEKYFDEFKKLKRRNSI